MSVVYVATPGAVVRVRGGRIEICSKERVLSGLPASTVEQIVLLGPAHLTTPACAFCLINGVEVCFLTSSGRYLGKLEPAFSRQLPARRAQYAQAGAAGFCLELSKAFVTGKLRNARGLVLRRSRQGEPRLESADRALVTLEDGLCHVEAARSADELRGVEGNATRAYFAALRQFITEDWGFERRTRRPPRDPANALLSLTYSLLHTQCLCALALTGLDPYLGFYHTDKYGRPALALDLMEEFRPLIADRVVLAAIGTRVVQLKDFRIGPVPTLPLLSREALRSYCRFFESRMRAVVQHPGVGMALSYRRCLEVQARLLAKRLLGEVGAYHPFVPGK